MSKPRSGYLLVCVYVLLELSGSLCFGTPKKIADINNKLAELQATHIAPKLLVPHYDIQFEGYDIIVGGEKLLPDTPEVEIGKKITIVYYWRCVHAFDDRGSLLARLWATHTHYNAGIFPLESTKFGQMTRVGEAITTSFELDTRSFKPGLHHLYVGFVGSQYDFKSLPWISWNELVGVGLITIVQVH